MKNKEGNTDLVASHVFGIRFSEVDSMNIVWHGSYSLYFEDAREAFGKKYGLGYLDIFRNGYYAPLVELSFSYKAPIVYGMECRIEIAYKKTEAAKLVFEYKIFDRADNHLLATGRSVQVFMDKEYKLLWTRPDFYEKWQEKWGVKP